MFRQYGEGIVCFLEYDDMANYYVEAIFSFQAVFNQMFFTEWMFLLARSCHFSDGKTGYLHFL